MGVDPLPAVFYEYTIAKIFPCHMKLLVLIWRDIEYIMDRQRKVNYYATADISYVALAG
jgi:hypothetical protein